MPTELPSILSLQTLLSWGAWFSFFYTLFWAYLPLALLAWEYGEATKRYV